MKNYELFLFACLLFMVASMAADLIILNRSLQTLHEKYCIINQNIYIYSCNVTHYLPAFIIMVNK